MSDETKTTDSSVADAATPTESVDTRFYLIVGALLMLMIVSMGGLWLMERGHRNRAENSLRAMAEHLEQQQKKMQIIGQAFAAENGKMRLVREELPAVPITFNGQRRNVFLVGPIQGGDLGLQPDDVIWVTPPVAAETQPATQPTSPPAER